MNFGNLQGGVQSTEFNDVLEHIGGWNIFQWKLFAVLILVTYFHAFVDNSPILYMYTPDHWCKINENYSNSLYISNQLDIYDILIPFDTTTKKRSQCLMYNPLSIENITEDKSKWQIIKCTHGWQYNSIEHFTSVTTQVKMSTSFLGVPATKAGVPLVLWLSRGRELFPLWDVGSAESNDSRKSWINRESKGNA